MTFFIWLVLLRLKSHTEEHLKAMMPSSTAIPVSTVGVWPTWPETLAMARRRFAERLLVYISRGAKALYERKIFTMINDISWLTVEMAAVSNHKKGLIMHNGILMVFSCLLLRQTLMSWGTNTPLLTLDIPQCVDVMWMCYRDHLEYHSRLSELAEKPLVRPGAISFGLPCGLRCVVLGLDATRPGRGSRRLRRHDAGLANATSSVTHFTQAVVEKLGIKFTLSNRYLVTVDIRDFPAKCLNFQRLANDSKWYEQLLMA